MDKIKNNVLKREDGLWEIHNPTIDIIVRGMMISTNDPGDIIVEKIDKKNLLVYIRHSIGGRREGVHSVHISKVKCVWDAGGYNKVMNLIGQFNKGFKNISKFYN